MATIRIIAILFCACTALTHVAGQKKQIDCETQKELLDIAVDNMTMMMNEWEMGFANEQELNNDYCIPFLEWFKVYNSYKSCLKAFPFVRICGNKHQEIVQRILSNRCKKSDRSKSSEMLRCHKQGILFGRFRRNQKLCRLHLTGS
jgi:hypothetical protein